MRFPLLVSPLTILLCSLSFAAAAEPRTVVSGLKNPASLATSSDNRTFVSIQGEVNQDADGAILEIKDGKAIPFAKGLDNPTALIAFQQSLFVMDKNRLIRVDLKSATTEVVVAEKNFTPKPTAITDMVIDEFGTIYLCDQGNGQGGTIYAVRINPFAKKSTPTVSVVTDSKKTACLNAPHGVLVESFYHLMIVDHFTGELNRYRLADGVVEKVADGLEKGSHLGFDRYGRMYITGATGKIWAIARPDEKPVLLGETKSSAGDLCLDGSNKQIFVVDAKAGAIVSVPAQPPGWEVDETPFALDLELAFDKVTWTGWDNGEESGKVVPFRPLVLTHANDQSNRVFLATQHGVIHAIKNDPKAEQTSKVFLDIQSKVYYNDNENEQGFLGLAFHPKFKENGEFFAFYTDKRTRLQNVLSRFRVSKTDPTQADPNSEEELLRISHRFWNHDGGTVCFGQDGYLYLVLGDGGAANDPDDHGQKMDTLLGKIIRIDINAKSDGKPYAIPKDNPFVGVDKTRPEIFASGVRNPWRLSFDRKTGQGWMAEVGQNLWEEINLLEKGGNYGWRRREGLHPFGKEGTGPRKEYIEPIWEYHHDIGKSITGGFVYRGSRLPELDGHYLYADYVTGKLWGLKYDESKKRVVANRPIKDKAEPVVSYGEDGQGEVYVLTVSKNGKGIFRFQRTDAKSTSR